MSHRHLTRYGFPPDLYAIIKSYLLQRTFRVKFGEVVTQLRDINSEVPQRSVLGSVLYLLYTADLPVALDTITATYTDDTAVLAADKDHIEASQRLQESLFYIQIWLKKWRIRVNGTKSTGDFHHPQKDVPTSNFERPEDPSNRRPRYLRLHLDRRLNWRKHVFIERKQLGIQLNKMYWMLGSKSQLSIESKLLLYKAIVKPIWTCSTLGHSCQFKYRNNSKISKQVPQNHCQRTLVRHQYSTPRSQRIIC